MHEKFQQNQALETLIVPRNVNKIWQKLFQRLKHDKVSKQNSAVTVITSMSNLHPPPQLNKGKI